MEAGSRTTVNCGVKSTGSRGEPWGAGGGEQFLQVSQHCYGGNHQKYGDMVEKLRLVDVFSLDSLI